MKREKVLLLSLVMLLLALNLANAADCGDVNSSGNVDIVDALLMAQYYVGGNPDNFDASAGDVNNDGTINIVDALLIARLYIGLISELDCPVSTPTPAPTNPPLTVIMPLGDSITDGFGVPGGYRIKLWSLIQGIGAKIDYVGSLSNGPSELGDRNHEGHSGWTISQVDSNINAWMNSYHPRIILLHIGTNDMLFSAASAPGNLGILIDKICAKLPSDGKLYVSNIIPMKSSNGAVQTYNAQIPGIIQSKANSGKPVFFVEMYNRLTIDDLADGVHPNRTGYDKMADAWFEAIQDDL